MLTEIHGLLAVGALLGGFVRGFAGFGGPMVMIPMLSVFYPPLLTLWMMVLIDALPTTYLVPTAWRHASAKIFVPLIIGSLLTVALGSYALVVVDELLMRRIICVCIILACIVLLSGWTYRGRVSTAGWLGVGGLSGLVMGAMLIAVVSSVFLNAASRDAQANRANFIVWGLAMTVVMIPLLGRHQLQLAEHLPLMALLGTTYFIGSILGTLLQSRSQNRYARPATLGLIIVVAGTSLMGSYGVF